MTIVDNYNKILQTINTFKRETKLIVVTKGQDLSKIDPLIQMGHQDFGENRVQEAYIKWQKVILSNPLINLHLIGKLQSNKAAEAFKIFNFIHTLENEKLANIFSKLENDSNRKIKYFIQVNIGSEVQKSGISINDLNDFVRYCTKELSLNILGLMCIPPINKDPDEYFSLLKSLSTKNGFKDLSMGMSSDYEKAIKFDSTYLRVGSAIFVTNSI
jgi:pyridoxal phosphate enzyme (YggS family)